MSLTIISQEFNRLFRAIFQKDGQQVLHVSRDGVPATLALSAPQRIDSEQALLTDLSRYSSGDIRAGSVVCRASDDATVAFWSPSFGLPELPSMATQLNFGDLNGTFFR